MGSSPFRLGFFFSNSTILLIIVFLNKRIKQFKKEKNYYKRHLHLRRYTYDGRDVLLIEKHKEVRFNENKNELNVI